jgi:uncharacterized protein with von Willebrand factor type A (vWA) domain
MAYKGKFELSKYKNIKSFDVEKHLYKRTLGLYKDLQDTLDKYRSIYPVIDHLAEDLYISVLRKVPEFEEKEMVNPYSYMNRALLEELNQSLAFRASTMQIRNDLVSTAYVLPGLIDYSMQQIVQSAGGEEELKKMFSGFGQGGAGAKKKLISIIKGAATKVGENVKGSSLNISQQIRNKVNVIRGMEALKDMVSWGQEKGAGFETDPNARLEMAMKLLQNEQLIGIFNMLGRLREALDKSVAQSTAGICLHKTEIKPSENISKAIGAELVYFSIPEMEDLPLMKAADHSILSYNHTASGYKMGPVVVCVDSSGSMMGEFDFWAKSLALCAAKHAITNDRTCHILLFSYDKSDMREYVFSAKKKIPASEFIEFAKYCICGGTDFEVPLERSMEIINSEDEEMVHADIMFISDGYCDISEDFSKKFLEFKKDRKVKMASFNVSEYECECLKNISEYYKNMTEFSEEQSNLHASEMLVHLPSVV